MVHHDAEIVHLLSLADPLLENVRQSLSSKVMADLSVTLTYDLNNIRGNME